MENLIKIKNYIIEKYSINVVDLSFLILIPIINVNYIIANKLYEKGFNIQLHIDQIIPFESGFVIPYLYWYIYIFLGLIFILSKDREGYIRTFIKIILGMCICYVIFYIFPTEINRPVIEGSSILDKLLQIVYSSDRPFNCFPSIHVLNTYLIMRNTKKVYNKRFFIYTQAIGVLIIFSTLFIKQHFVLDIIAAILIGEIMIFLVKKIDKKYIGMILDFPYKVVEKVIVKVKSKDNIEEENI
ncbi:phosphatase PAP2 family protein [Clostridium sp.]|uniref:phosphatase PAP2 family protein n=1 Tax=Clostridium sp. TaxID=1506 RepID=UPI003F3C48EA